MLARAGLQVEGGQSPHRAILQEGAMFLAPKALTNVDKHSKQWAMCQLQLYWVYMTMQRSFFLGSHLPFLP
jgi:hypothetical protein